MTREQKIAAISAILGDMELTTEQIGTYLDLAKAEILAWRYSYSEQEVTEVPTEYESTQIEAVVVGLSIQGAEGQLQHTENGISRQFNYATMINYIRAHVIPIARCL